MVELDFLARRAKLSVEETIQALKEAGMDSCPGGGAEIFAERAREIICDHKVSAERWLTLPERCTNRVSGPMRRCFMVMSKPWKSASTT